MRMGYVTGNPHNVSLEDNATYIRVPAGESEVVVLHLLYSGKIVVEVGEEGGLVLSVIDNSLEKKHQVDMELRLSNHARYVQTFNFRGKNGRTNFSVQGNVGAGGDATMNTIMGAGNFEGHITISLSEHSTCNAHALVVPLSKLNTNMYTSFLHQGSSSYGTIECAGSIRNNSTCRFEGRISIPPGLRDVVSHVKGRFIAFPGSVVSTLPVLNVHSKDVKTGHSVCVSNIQKEEVEYLQSRGISREDATKLIESGLILSMLNKMGWAISEAQDAKGLKVYDRRRARMEK